MHSYDTYQVPVTILAVPVFRTKRILIDDIVRSAKTIYFMLARPKWMGGQMDGRATHTHTNASCHFNGTYKQTA